MSETPMHNNIELEIYEDSYVDLRPSFYEENRLWILQFEPELKERTELEEIVDRKYCVYVHDFKDVKLMPVKIHHQGFQFQKICEKIHCFPNIGDDLTFKFKQTGPNPVLEIELYDYLNARISYLFVKKK
mgnify:FL=1